MSDKQLYWCIGVAFAALVFLAAIGIAILIDYLEGEKKMTNKKHDDAVDSVDYAKYALNFPTYAVTDSPLSKLGIIIDCESITLKNGKGNSEIELSEDTISKYESITINGVKFTKVELKGEEAHSEKTDKIQKIVEDYVDDVIDAMHEMCVAYIRKTEFLDTGIVYRIVLELEKIEQPFNLTIQYSTFKKLDVMETFVRYYSYLMGYVLEEKLKEKLCNEG